MWPPYMVKVEVAGRPGRLGMKNLAALMPGQQRVSCVAFLVLNLQLQHAYLRLSPGVSRGNCEPRAGWLRVVEAPSCSAQRVDTETLARRRSRGERGLLGPPCSCPSTPTYSNTNRQIGRAHV